MDFKLNDKIPTNLRLLFILEQIAQAGTPVTPTEINRFLNLPKPSIHRLFTTLEDAGFIERDIDGRHYSVARRMRALSVAVLSSARLRTARMAILTKVAEELGETCNIALPDRNAMVYLDRVETKWPLRIQLPIGTKVPLYCTASGKMYLASLDNRTLKGYVNAEKLEKRTPNTITNVEGLLQEIQTIRKQGFSIDRQEFMQDMVAFSCPVYAANGGLAVTISTHGPKQRLSAFENIEDTVKVLRNGAEELEKLLSK